ncbi:MAG: N-acetylglucosamine-6-phosphate deacetylase [Clostridia bacterium]|nr:N-acetylglucosamine-6-phosphate deacetylase [Clostridia bacterium]
MRLLVDNARVYNTEQRRCIPGSMLCADGKIIEVNFGPEDKFRRENADYVINAGGECLIPGLVDVHTHGRAGNDFNFADKAAMKEMAHSYAVSGTTSLFPTLASAPFSELCRAAELIRSLRADTDGAEFIGIHLEGRYLSPEKRGAHDAGLLAKPDADELNRFLSFAGIPLHVSAALELDAEGRFAAAAKSAGVTLGLAHTAATYSQALEAYRMWNVSFTHLYNAMPPLHHRDGGAVLAAFESGAYAELICDGFHICPEMIKFTLGNTGLERVVLITDSMAAAGAPDGEYMIAGNPAVVRNGIARTPDGALAGSTLSLDKAVENFSRFCDISLADALVCATANPAAEVGLDGTVGCLASGARADFVICRMDEGQKSLGIRRVFVAGKEITA